MSQRKPAQRAILDEQSVILPPGGVDGATTGNPDPPYIVHGRDLRVDLLRGYFVVAMVVDHVRGQSPLYLFTGGNRFYTSAAEGFILDLRPGGGPGLCHGIIARDGLAAGFLKLLTRAATLYLLTVGVTLLFLPASEILYLPWAQGVDLTDVLSVLVSIVTLHRTYYLIDVMLLYTVLFLLVPTAFVLMNAGKSGRCAGRLLAAVGAVSGLPRLCCHPLADRRQLPVRLLRLAGPVLHRDWCWATITIASLCLAGRAGVRRRCSSPVWGPLTLVGVVLPGRSPDGGHVHRHRPGQAGLPRARPWLQDMVFSKDLAATRPAGRLGVHIHLPVSAGFALLAADPARAGRPAGPAGSARPLCLHGAHSSSLRCWPWRWRRCNWPTPAPGG